MILKKINSDKGQAGLEIIVVISTITLIFLLLYIFLISPVDERARQKISGFEAEAICDKVSSAVNLAAYSGDGFFINFSIPELLNAKTPYNVTIYSDEAVVTWRPFDSTRACHFSAAQILYELEPPRVVKFAYLLKEPCLYDVLQQFEPDVYCNRKFSNDCPEIDVFCASLTTEEREASYYEFLQNVSQYDFLFIEDPHFDDVDLEAVENNTRDVGTYIFISEHIGIEARPIFGNVTYVKRGKNSEDEEITIIKEDYLLGFEIDDTFIPAEYPYVSGSNGFDTIGTYPDSKVGVAGWDYENGKVYYFSDFDAEMIGENYRDKVVDSINKTLIELSKYDRPPFTLNQTYYNVKNEDGNIIFFGWS